MQVERERERTRKTRTSHSEKRTTEARSYTQCRLTQLVHCVTHTSTTPYSHGSVHVSLCCLFAPGLLWRSQPRASFPWAWTCARAGGRRDRESWRRHRYHTVAHREHRQLSAATLPRPGPASSASRKNYNIYNTKSHLDAATIIRSRATIPARSHEHVPHGPRFPQ